MKLRRRNLSERYHGKPVRRSFTERTQAAGPGEKPEWLPESHLIKNLCMLSPDSRNGRTYTDPAMDDLLEMYDGARGYQDHPDDPEAPRSTKERLGRWHSPRKVNGKIRGDFHYDPNHPYAQSLIWAVQNCPEHCGVSHNVEAEGYEDPDTGHFTVTKINRVRSVDIVDDPATNRSLLESHSRRRPKRRRNHKLREGAMDPELEDDGMGDDGMTPEHKLGEYIMACYDDGNLDDATMLKNIKKALELRASHRGGGDDGEGDEMEEDDEDVVDKDPEDEREEPAAQEPEKDDQFEEWDDTDDGGKEAPMKAKESREARESLVRLRKHKDKKVRAVVEIALRALPKPRQRVVRVRDVPESIAQHPEFRRMAKRLDTLEAEKIAVQSIRQVIAECRKYGLPQRGITQVFVEDLADCPDPKRRKRAIQERAHAMSVRLPRSFGPGGVGGGAPQVSNEEFAGMVYGEME